GTGIDRYAPFTGGVHNAAIDGDIAGGKADYGGSAQGRVERIGGNDVDRAASRRGIDGRSEEGARRAIVLDAGRPGIDGDGSARRLGHHTGSAGTRRDYGARRNRHVSFAATRGNCRGVGAGQIHAFDSDRNRTAAPRRNAVAVLAVNFDGAGIDGDRARAALDDDAALLEPEITAVVAPARERPGARHLDRIGRDRDRPWRGHVDRAAEVAGGDGGTAVEDRDAVARDGTNARSPAPGNRALSGRDRDVFTRPVDRVTGFRRRIAGGHDGDVRAVETVGDHAVALYVDRTRGHRNAARGFGEHAVAQRPLADDAIDSYRGRTAISERVDACLLVSAQGDRSGIDRRRTVGAGGIQRSGLLAGRAGCIGRNMR